MEQHDILRARFAHREVHNVTWQGPEAKDYRNELHAAATLVQQLGLAQTLAFYAARGKADRARVREQILAWLAECELTRALVEAENNSSDGRYEQLLNADAQGHMLATDEAQAVLLWFKRFADGRWDKDGNEHSPEGGQ